MTTTRRPLPSEEILREFFAYDSGGFFIRLDTITQERQTIMTTTEIKKALKDVIANLEPEVCIQTLIDNSATEFNVDPVELMKAYQDCYRLNSGYGIGDKESSIPDAELLEVMK